MSNEDKKDSDFGSYIILDGKRREVRRHPTDFSVDTSQQNVQRLLPELPKTNARQLSIGMSRVAASEPASIDKTMATARERAVAHHIYELADTGEDIVIADRIFLKLKEVDPTDLNAALAQHNLIFTILMENKLILEKMIGNRCTLKVTSDSGRNPLKIANEIATLDGVASCVPEILLAIQFGSLCTAPAIGVEAAANQHVLFKNQWHLSTAGVVDTPLWDTASINVLEAWDAAKCFGKPEIVIAVIDDGFDLPEGANPISRHPAFTGTVVDTVHMKNFNPPDIHETEIHPERNITSRENDFHGTCVASVIAASEGSMLGVAPCCTLLPIRLGAILAIRPEVLRNVLVAISPLADVVNCSFALKPQSYSMDNLDHEFLPAVRELMKSGGKRPGKGLIIVFAAGNDNAPIKRTEHTNGITFVKQGVIHKETFTIGPTEDYHCPYTELDGVVVVGAMTSIKRKAAYSNWGEQLTVVAPSDNGHELTEFRSNLKRTNPAFQQLFPGLGIVSAVNRTSHGSVPEDRPAEEIPFPPPDGTRSNPCTRNFGGTSAAAAIVSGVIGLMLSVNGNLTRQRVIEILTETAEHGNDTVNTDKLVDLKVDEPNLLGINGAFGADNRSLFFGAGKVDAAKAVKAAKP